MKTPSAEDGIRSLAHSDSIVSKTSGGTTPSGTALSSA